MVESMEGHSLLGSHLAFLVAMDGSCRMACRPSSLKPEKARWMIEQFRTFLTALYREPETRVAELPLLTNSERKQILFDWNDTAAPFPEDESTPQLFEQQVERTPAAIALVFKEEQLSYAVLNARANRLARHLRKFGVGADMIVGLCVERSIDMVVGLLGIQKAGGAYLPLDPTYPKERLAFILQDAKVHVLITEDRFIASLPAHQAEVVRLDLLPPLRSHVVACQEVIYVRADTHFNARGHRIVGELISRFLARTIMSSQERQDLQCSNRRIISSLGGGQ
jgi:non-ribosomal peptide synthetase component F